jgi:hypothetical protein
LYESSIQPIRTVPATTIAYEELAAVISPNPTVETIIVAQ